MDGRRWRVVALALAIAVPALVPSVPVIAADPPVVCSDDGVDPVALPSGATATLATDVASVDGEPRWAVGVRAGAGVPRRPWIAIHTTSGWVRVVAPSAGTDAGLMAVAAAPSGAAWAVGFRAVGRDLRPVVMRGDGRGWQTLGVPLTGGSEGLADVSIDPAGQPWIAGHLIGSRGPRPVILRKHAGAWDVWQPSVGRGFFGALTAIDATGPSGPWAVGWRADGGSPQPLILHRVDGQWERVTTGLESDAETVLTGLDVGPNGRVTITGYRRLGARLRAVVWRTTPGGWVADPDLAAIVGSLLPDDVAVDEAGRTTIVGGYRLPGSSSYGALIARRDGDGWSLVANPDGTTPRGHLRAVIARAEAFAVGWTSSGAIAQQTCGALPPAPIGPAGRRGARAVPDAGARASVPRRQRPDQGDRPDAGTVSGPRGSAGELPGPGRPVVAAGITFRDVAATAGVAMTASSYGATVLDIDADHLPDLVISRHIGQAPILRNTGGRFVAAVGGPLPTTDRHGCAAADVDGDGSDDLFCAIGAARGMRLKHNELWLDLDTDHPRQVSAAWGVDDPLTRGRRATFVDLDGDPWPDLVISSDPIRVDGLPSLVRAYRNVDGTGFTPAPDLGLELPVGGACALDADLDGDGRAEIVLCTEEAWAGLPAGAHLWRSVKGRFRDASTALGITPAHEVDAAAGDLDQDGRMDLVTLSATHLAVHLQRDGRQERVLTIGVRAGTAVAIGDANGDDHPDLYVVQGGSGNAPDLLLLNDGDGRSYTSVRIPQASSGSADDVVVLDHDDNGTADFLVTNGAAFAGPVQLIAGYP